MRLDRLAIDTSDERLSLVFHPRLSVIDRRDGPLAESIAELLVGGLSGRWAGVHPQVVIDGRPLAFLRPVGGACRVVDVAAGTIMNGVYRRAGGGFDVLVPTGLDHASARAAIVVRSLERDTTTDARLERLAGLDPRRLWPAAARLMAGAVAREDRLRRSIPDADADHRFDRSLAVWARLAPGMSPNWVLAHREVVEEVMELGAADAALRSSPRDDARPLSLLTSLFTRAMTAQIAGRAIGGLPLIVDDAFRHAPADIRRALMGVAQRLSVHQQVIVVTSDDAVVDWASLGGQAGDVAMVRARPLHRAHPRADPADRAAAA